MIDYLFIMGIPVAACSLLAVMATSEFRQVGTKRWRRKRRKRRRRRKR